MALWWRFSVPGAGTHQFRAKNVGIDGEEITIDGAPVEAPVGTTTFTGPGGTLLELRPDGSSWTLFVDGTPAEAFNPSAPVGSSAAGAVWWKFSIPGDTAIHQVRVKDLGGAQEVLIDGAPLQAPAGTTTFTGPGGTLLELKDAGGVLGLFVDGQEAERFDPQAGQAPAVPVAMAWWRFTSPGGGGVHQVRVTNLGGTGQEVIIDGAPVLAPDGTTTFTGPGGVLMVFEPREGDWVLLVDGRVAERYFPDVDPSEAPRVWQFEVPGAGLHEVRVEHAGKQGQAVYIDGTHVPGPQGQMTFTGPAATLLDLREEGGDWVLLVDGIQVPGGQAVAGMGGGGALASWTFFGPNMTCHEFQIANLGLPGQSVFMDGEHVPAPDGQTAFTGPAGMLLEVRPSSGSWSLYIDGVGIQEHNAKFGGGGVAASTPAPTPPRHNPLAAEADLPQGVSLNRDTGKFQANLRIGGRFLNLGEYATPEEAAAKYQEAKQRHSK